MEMSRRSKQVAGAIQVELADLLRRELNDPRLQAVGWVTISEVEIASDHRNANVYVSFMGQEERSVIVQEALKALKHSSGFLHRALMKRLALRSIPQLNFRYDNSFDYAQKVSVALKEAQDVEAAAKAMATPVSPTDPSEDE
jgi:ribosome-binding factor A